MITKCSLCFDFSSCKRVGIAFICDDCRLNDPRFKPPPSGLKPLKKRKKKKNSDSIRDSK
jgi:hypothetical protein